MINRDDVLLTLEEKAEITKNHSYVALSVPEWIASLADILMQAQAQKIVELGDEECSAHKVRWHTTKRECPYCWQQIKEIVEKEKNGIGQLEGSK